MTELHTVPEAAARLRMHPKSLYRLIREQRITVIRNGRRVLITEHAIEEYLASGTRLAVKRRGSR
jgi:excisionase family DNA binding protein